CLRASPRSRQRPTFCLTPLVAPFAALATHPVSADTIQADSCPGSSAERPPPRPFPQRRQGSLASPAPPRRQIVATNASFLSATAQQPATRTPWLLSWSR